MIELPLYNKTGDEINKVKVDENLFGGEVHKKVLREAIVMYEVHQRQGTASTKGRSEVKGSTRKPWKQKHTGRARAGTVRSPIWRHGGTVFGPHPRDYSYQLPKKILRRALDSAILSKFQDNQTAVIESFNEMPRPCTKEMAVLLKKIGFDRGCLIGVCEHNRIHLLSTRNIPNTLLLPVQDFNAYTVLKYKNMLLTKDALAVLISQRQSRYLKRDKEVVAV